MRLPSAARVAARLKAALSQNKREPTSPRTDLPFPRRSPFHAQRVSRVIKLALDGILDISLVETEDFIAQVEAISHHTQPPIEPVAPLNIVLRVSVEVLIPVGALQPDDWISRSPIIHPEVRVDARVVMA